MSYRKHPREVYSRRIQRWAARLISRRSYRVMEWDAWRDCEACVKEVVKWEWVCGWHSAHADWQIGAYFEAANRGGHAQHYGYHSETWLLLVCLGRRTFRLGLGFDRPEVRLYDSPEDGAP